MPINRIEIKDFLVFRDEFTMDFCPGINIIIGTNATGKTTLLKAMYESVSLENYFYTEGARDEPAYVQSNGIPKYITFIGSTFAQNRHYVCLASFQDKIILLEFIDKLTENQSDKYVKIITSDALTRGEFVYIPEKDVLTNSSGILALNKKYGMIPFDQTFIDMITNVGLPVSKDVSAQSQKILDLISKVINGQTSYENGEYYILKNDGQKVAFATEASGYRKFGTLWKLIRNGLLESGALLFWDEPENSLNPELMPVLIDILLELQRNGVQIFLATHNHILARYFDLKRTKDDAVMFHNLSNDGKQILCNSMDDYTKLKPSVLETADEALFKAVVAKTMGINGSD
ncbi:MAG: AAA family ATPase [Prevotellaceae bacterium]|jgi:AAA15 family ATPase/GTPase|nr:AAA family ATPase [Prevotellaceae bacterium]